MSICILCKIYGFARFARFVNRFKNLGNNKCLFGKNTRRNTVVKCLYPLLNISVNGIVIFGTSPYNEEVSEKSFRMAYEYHRRALDVRRTGSAAIDLCNIAAGRAELFCELVLSPWDYAAGALIVEEAGGIVTDADGRALSLDRKCSIVARNAVMRPL